jgi:iron complex outermembrane receptor protein
VDLKGGWSGLRGAIETVNLRFGINDYEHVELEGDEIGTRFTNDSYEGRLELVHAPVGLWTGEFGVQLGEREFSAIGEEAFVPPVDTTTYGVFLIEQLELDLWSLSLGARYETQEHAPTGAAAFDDSAVSFSAAAVREIDGGYSFAVNLASAERLPVAEELFADGPHLASGVIEIGDPTLGTETSRHLDIGLRKTAGDLTWSVTAFATDYEDFIFLRDTGTVDPNEELPVFAFDQQGAQFSGLEAEVFTPIANVGPGEFDLRIFADYVSAELDNGDDVPRIPPLRYGARLSYHTDRIAVGLEAMKYEEQDDVAPFEETTAGYTLVSADLDWAIPTRGGTDLSLFVRAANLLDKEARRHTSLVKDIAPLPGRNFSIGVRARF